ncbi:hypothetical protein T07_2416 [Trichinella nelsoni]|uniref:Uncharacterized protein n=1 Tax=Trichinella nelsoni TaxID=6336 RepID=A0A0V0S332_9BILA|nr:hypothetical protein T07_2416 [Trichinella nelsoni]
MSNDQKYIQKSTQEHITAGPLDIVLSLQEKSLHILICSHSQQAQSGGFRSRNTDAQSLRCDFQSRRRQWRRCIAHPALPGADSADSGSLPVSSTLFWNLKPSLLHYP